MPLRPLRYLAAACVAACAAYLVSSPALQAFTTLGHTLPLDQRDVRVFNNFADPEANDNVAAHPSWPGALGAPLAVWKAVAEWGSRLHGNGEGDASQPGDLGSGGANFDAVWQGAAPDVGATNANVVSALSGCAGGVIAVTELGSGGWRMRLCESVLWDDGPGTLLSAGALDLQGVVAHEYGHVLGLGHSSVTGATMGSTLPGNGVAARSIEPDDQAGVQFLYGAAGPAKPRIDSALPGALLVLSGANFAPAGNEVWLTRAGVNLDGTPLVVAGLTSAQAGSRIELAIPAGAGPGDVLVRVPGAGGDALSNAFPLDPGGCPPPAVYCTPKTSSQGCVPAISGVGSPSASAGSGFFVAAAGVPSATIGLLFYGPRAGAAPFMGGILCVAGAIRRTAAQNSGGSQPSGSDCTGAYGFDFNAWIAGGQDPALGAGATVFCQYWYRDPGFPPPDASGLSDGLAFLVCP